MEVIKSPLEVINVREQACEVVRPERALQLCKVYMVTAFQSNILSSKVWFCLPKFGFVFQSLVLSSKVWFCLPKFGFVFQVSFFIFQVSSQGHLKSLLFLSSSSLVTSLLLKVNSRSRKFERKSSIKQLSIKFPDHREGGGRSVI